ncbi:MAG TPA: hypothetical protein VEK08_04375 [Planctomycetota bacterium]|nr:hypothetical protein [Planctomycetota bacterium]
MGADPWFYVVPFQSDIQKAMEELQHEVFATANYRGSEDNPRNIDEARENAAESGTNSILDMYQVVDADLEHEDEDNVNFANLAETMCRIFRLSDTDLRQLFNTTQPSLKMIESNRDFYDWLGRGVGVYIVAYTDKKPTEIVFAGYSID